MFDKIVHLYGVVDHNILHQRPLLLTLNLELFEFVILVQWTQSREILVGDWLRRGNRSASLSCCVALLLRIR